MDISSLLIFVTLFGQVEERVPLAGDRAAAPLDEPMESADENPAIEEENPKAMPGEAEPAEPDALSEDAVSNAAPPAKDSPEALLQWLAEGDTALQGKPIALVDLLSRVNDRQQRALVIPAYWQLFAAACEYRIAADEAFRLTHLLPPADGSGRHASHPVIESRLAAAEARVREAELAVLAQQYTLADHMRLPANEPLPLAADLPHSGAYRTFFQERYARSAPPKLHLIDRTLPLMHRSIELRAAATISAADSADAETDAYRAGQLDLVAVIDSISELSRQRRNFVVAVRDYNFDIAEYALTVVPPALTSSQLVSVLIGPPPTAPDGRRNRKEIAEGRRGVKQAAFEAPIEAAGAPRVRVPTLAPERNPKPLRRLPDGANPTFEQTPDSDTPAQPNAPKRLRSRSPADTSRLQPAGRRHTVAKPPRIQFDAPATDGETAERGDDQTDEQPAEPPTDEQVMEGRGQVEEPMPGAAGEERLYGGLDELSSLKRAQELSATVHWKDDRDESQGTSIRLADALSVAPTGNWRALIAAYWHCQQQIAAWRALNQEAEMLKALQPLALRRAATPGAAEEMLRLHTAQLSVSAAVEETRRAILAAQFDLAALLRRPLDRPWPWPVTSPHAGGYRLKLDAQPANVLQASHVRQLVEMLPKRHTALQRHADAVVGSDDARVAMLADYQAGQRPLIDAVSAVRRLTNETLAFLDSQSQYNVEFADYALAVAPAGVPASVLAKALVLE